MDYFVFPITIPLNVKTRKKNILKHFHFLGLINAVGFIKSAKKKKKSF